MSNKTSGEKHNWKSLILQSFVKCKVAKSKNLHEGNDWCKKLVFFVNIVERQIENFLKIYCYHICAKIRAVGATQMVQK